MSVLKLAKLTRKSIGVLIQVARVSKACTSICMWVRAMHSYYLVCKVVAPKRAQLAEAQAVLDSVLKQLAEAQQKLKEV
jgi:dynein heavy chain